MRDLKRADSRPECVWPVLREDRAEMTSERRDRFLSGCTGVLALLAVVWVLRPLTLSDHDGRALEFVDRNGLRLGTILSRDGSHAASIPLEQISPAFVNALLATEDARFFAHGAVDLRGALRATFGAARQRRAPSGASTISMQLARLLHPVPAGLAGRFQELVLAARLENAASKRSILEAYCNRAPMGGNVYGVEAAALTYFGVHASDLDLAQATLLAGIPNDPQGLEPYEHWKALRLRQRVVLARMVAAGLLTRDGAWRAAAETVALRARDAGIVAAPHFIFWLAPQVAKDATVVRTTLDRPLQEFVEEQLRSVVRTLATNDVRDAAALVVANRTGDVLAYAGSPDYFDDVALGRNDGVQALRQPGSALKPFLYELALERRVLRPNSILLDAPIAYAIPGGRLYQPSDYDRRFLGPVRVRIALADSLNVPAVRALERVGVPAFLARLHALGFAHLRNSADYYGLGLTLGGGEVSLYELTRAFATLANGGNPVALTALPNPQRGVGRATAVAPAWALVTDILADRHARAEAFGVDSVLALPFPSAVKTGTSSDFRDTWTVGFTRDFTVGVWVGNFDGAPMRAVSGVSGAGPLWNRIMLHLHERSEPGAFAHPAGYRLLPICASTGLHPRRGCGPLALEWLDAADRVAYLKGARLAARPAPFAIAFPREGDRFALLHSAGPQRIDITLSPPDPAGVRVTVDGRRLARHGGSYTWDLRLGSHIVAAAQGADVARVHVAVERPPRTAREGFSPVLP